MIVAAHLDRNVDHVDDKEVKSIHAIFARAGDYSQPIRYEVDTMHDGRTIGSDTVTFSQGGRVMSRGMILWSKDEPDLIRHTANVEMPDGGRARRSWQPPRPARLPRRRRPHRRRHRRLEPGPAGARAGPARLDEVLRGPADRW